MCVLPGVCWPSPVGPPWSQTAEVWSPSFCSVCWAESRPRSPCRSRAAPGPDPELQDHKQHKHSNYIPQQFKCCLQDSNIRSKLETGLIWSRSRSGWRPVWRRTHAECGWAVWELWPLLCTDGRSRWCCSLPQGRGSPCSPSSPWTPAGQRLPSAGGAPETHTGTRTHRSTSFPLHLSTKIDLSVSNNITADITIDVTAHILPCILHDIIQMFKTCVTTPQKVILFLKRVPMVLWSCLVWSVSCTPLVRIQDLSENLQKYRQSMNRVCLCVYLTGVDRYGFFRADTN